MLLVDDEPIVRMSTADMLTDLGYGVIEAASGEEALLLLERELQFDMLVTDHLMPGITGADLIAAVRDRRPGMSALIITGFANAETIPDNYLRLAKPFRQADLTAILPMARATISNIEASSVH